MDVPAPEIAAIAEPLAIVDDAHFDAHADPEGAHPECPERLAAARDGLQDGLEGCAVWRVEARPARVDELARVHRVEFVQGLLEALSQGEGRLDRDTYFNSHTRLAALHAAGGAVALAETLSSRTGPRRGFALLRPPGHHAEPGRAMGFCMFNNVAVAARAAQAAGRARVAIVDFDVHHGNGTQAAFYADPSVLFVSLHQYPFYPGTGAAHEVGRGAGVGTNVNVGLPFNSGPEEYGAAMRGVVLPALRWFKPDLILCSAGFDAHKNDPLAQMNLDAQAFAAIVTALVDAAHALCEGRLGLLLEGGYDLAALSDCTSSTTRALRGHRVELPEGTSTARAAAAIAETQHYFQTVNHVALENYP